MWIDAVRDRLAERTGMPLSVMHVGLDGHWQDKILLFCWRPDHKRPALVCRLSRSEIGSAWLRREAASRLRARHALPGSLRDAMPWVRLEELPFGAVLVEPWVPGSCPAAPATLEDIDRFATRTLGWLRGFGEATRRESPPITLSRSASRMVSLAARRIADPDVREWVLERRAEVSLLDRLEPCAVHGDFWRGNLRQDGQILRVIDWEFIQSAGNPYFDAALNLLALCRELPGADPVTWFERCFLRQTDHSRLFGRLLDAFGVASREACALTVVLALVEHAARDRSQDVALLQTLKYRLLARIARERDPVGTVTRALWPDRPTSPAHSA